MLKDDSYYQNSVTAENIADLSEMELISSERRVCELSELAGAVAEGAASLVGDGLGIQELLDAVMEDFTLEPSLGFSDTLSENVSHVSSYLNSIVTKDKAVFSAFLTEELRRRGVSVSESDFLIGGGEEETFVYVKNRLADEAYDVFSQDFSDPRVSYIDSFKAAARGVSRGDYGYCLLPLEERGGSRLSGIAEILFSEDLKINSVTPVFGMDGSADMKYALVSRRFSVPELDTEDDRYLEIRISAASSKELSDLTSVAESLSISVYRINTVTFETADGPEPYFTVVLKSGNGSDFSALLVYLTMFCKSYTAVGIYKNLE